MVSIKIVSLNAEPGAPELNAVPAVRPSKPRKKTSKNEPPGPWREELHRFFGVDLTVIPAISILTGITLMTELGNDLSAFKTAQDFSSWLCLCPDNETSASKVLRRATRKSQNRVRQALRTAASSLHHDKKLSGREVPTLAHQTRCSKGHYGHGPPNSQNHLVACHVALWRRSTSRRIFPTPEGLSSNHLLF